MRKKTIARMRSGTARQTTMSVRALPRATAPVVVFHAAKTATGSDSLTESRVASVTMARVCAVSETSSPSGGKSSGKTRWAKAWALATLSARLAMLMRSSIVDQIAAASRPRRMTAAPTACGLGGG